MKLHFHGSQMPFLAVDSFLVSTLYLLSNVFYTVFSHKLTWRDVQHLIARSSKPLARPKSGGTASLSKPTWTRNAANLKGINLTFTSLAKTQF